jgi:hypothetical protein
MKSLILAFALLFSVATTTAFANETTVTPQVLKSFKSSFGTAKEVAWTVTQNFYKVDFQLDGQYATAYYLSDGSLGALTRNVTMAQLPVMLQAGIKKTYDQYWISELFEVTTESNTQYFITLENGNEKVVLQSTSGLNWANYTKTKKN